MPHFSVKLDTGAGSDEPQEFDFPDIASASKDAQRAMIEIAREAVPGEKTAHLGVEIADEIGEPVYKAALDFREHPAVDSEPAPYTAEALPLGPRD